jgi:Tol biopolymer transport system component
MDGGMNNIKRVTKNNPICFDFLFTHQRSFKKVVLSFLTTFILIALMTTTGGCMSINSNDKDSIANLSFNHDGKKVVFDRCRNEGCQIQLYDLGTGELAAYQSPHNERWTMGKYSYDGKRIAFSVIPIKPNDDLELGKMQIAVMDANGKNYRKVTTGPGAKLYPIFSHNGKKILYACAARIRESGRTPAADYDVWEVNLETGAQTQLTFYEYFNMGNLTYFPDDERFIFYGDIPCLYEGLRCYPNEDAFRVRMRELNRQGKSIGGVVVMKGKELIKNPYVFPKQITPHKPLLSKDGSVLIYGEYPSEKFYIYSEDREHRYIAGGGGIDAAAISPDGNLLAMISVGLRIKVYTIIDGKLKQSLYLPCTPQKITNWNIRPEFKHLYKMIPEKPSRIIN